MKSYYSANIKLGLMFMGVLLLFTQCKEEDYTGYSTVVPTSPTVGLDWTAPASMEEENVSFPFTITLSETQVVDVHINVAATDASTATEGEDFDLDAHTFVIPAGQLSVSGELLVYRDNFYEETETVVLQFGDERTANADFTPQTVSLELTDYTQIYGVFDWSGTMDVNGTEVSFCDADIDIYVFDTDGNILPYYSAATGNCPEVLSIGGWADGTYVLASYLWYNGLSTSPVTIPLPIRMEFVQLELYEEGPFDQDASTIIDSSMADYYSGNADYPALVRVEVANGNYSFFDATTGDPLF